MSGPTAARLARVFGRILGGLGTGALTGAACGGVVEDPSKPSADDPIAVQAMCGDGSPPPFPAGLRAAPLQDWAAIRSETAFAVEAPADGGSAVPDVDHFRAILSGASGTPCATATDVAACRAKLDSFRVLPRSRAECENAYPNWVHPLGTLPGCTVEYVLYTRGDEVAAAITDADVRALIADVDSIQEADWVLERTYKPTCGSSQGQSFTVRPLAEGGFEFVFVNECEQAGLVRTVIVEGDGTLTVRPPFRAPDGTQFTCAIAGRRPEGFVCSAHDAAERSPAAAWFASMAELEMASVGAFRRLARELQALGAPYELVARARAAARDEVRHARAAYGLAQREGARVGPRRVNVSNVPRRSARSVAIENAREGCVRELYGALLTWHQALRAEDPVIRAVLGPIAVDETAHAALALDVDSWLSRSLSAADHAAVHRARQDEERFLEREVAAPAPPALAARLGLPPPQAARRMLAELRASHAVGFLTPI